ncbi:MAG: methyltransferase domain-containing protein [Magnetococcales bacterium]|nr:methyltransferase domain-containing protein [Magnetococcales bacterium]
MNFEAIRLQSWYATAQGRTVAHLIGVALAKWLSGQRVPCSFGLGYTQPYLERLKEWTDALWGAAPAEMGVAPWPTGAANRIALVRPDALPFPDECFQRVIMTHLLEGTQSPASALRETWRVLTPGGRLVVVVPNRGGLWARRDATPFGWGRPYSPKQMQEQLQASLFIPRQAQYALFMPPFAGERWLKGANAWEKAGARWFAPLGGVILCEAEKVVYATTRLTAGRTQALGASRKLGVPVAENRDTCSWQRREL